MKAIDELRAAGQSLWLDNITRAMLDDGTLARYIDEWQVSGLTSNPSIFEKAIGAGASYDAAIRAGQAAGLAGEALLVDLALGDLRRAAELFRPIHAASAGRDGWVSMEISPLHARDARASIEAAAAIHRQAGCRNLFVKIPGTPESLPAIEESIFAGIPVNVTLLFSSAQCRAAVDACLRGFERRLAAGSSEPVACVASVFVSRWDTAVAGRVPAELRNRLGLAVAGEVWCDWRELEGSQRWQRLAGAGQQMPRLLWASTSTKDPEAPDTLYVDNLVAAGTVNTLPEHTLAAFAAHGAVPGPMRVDRRALAGLLQSFAIAGIDLAALAEELQRAGAEAFVKSWQALLAGLADKARSLAT